MKVNPIKKTIFQLLSVFLIVFGVFSLIVSYFFYRELRQWHNTNPLDISVDMSQPGELSEQFTLKCPYAFSYDLWLVLPHSFSGELVQKELLDGLEAYFSITDHSGSDIMWLREIPLEQLTKSSEKRILLKCIGLLPENTYTLNLSVSQGAKALLGVEQRLIIDYNIGFVTLLPILTLFIGIPTFVFGLVLAFLEHNAREVTCRGIGVRVPG